MFGTNATFAPFVLEDDDDVLDPSLPLDEEVLDAVAPEEDALGEDGDLDETDEPDEDDEDVGDDDFSDEEDF